MTYSVCGPHYPPFAAANPTTSPVLTHEHIADVKSIDHNLYVKDGIAYMANYCQQQCVVGLGV